MPKPHRHRVAAIALAAMFGAGSTAALAQAAPPQGCEGPPSAIWLNVSVSGVRNDAGLIAVTLYADVPGKFLAHHGSLYTGRYAAHRGTTRTCIFVPGSGIYAIAVYHDENASRKLDRNALGLPTEGFGFSNNPSTFIGIPAFRSVRLDIPRANLLAPIKLRYP